MPEFAPIHWKVFEKFLFFVGCAFVDQKGAHRKYWRSGLRRPVIITVSKGGEIPRQHIKTNLKTLEMSVREYLEILRRVK